MIKGLVISAMMLMSFAASANQGEMCGEVFVSEQSCDVDFCLIGFMTKDESGSAVTYSLTDGGILIDADYEAGAVESLLGKTVCADKNTVTAFGTIEISDLKVQ